MGFSTSGGILLIFIALALAFGMVVPAVFNIAETTGDAFGSQAEQIREQGNIEIGIENVSQEEDGETYELEIESRNNGSETLALRSTHLLVDGEYVPLEETDEHTIDDGSHERPGEETDLWLPGSVLTITVSTDALDTDGPVESVTIVTERGIAERTDVDDPENGTED